MTNSKMIYHIELLRTPSKAQDKVTDIFYYNEIQMNILHMRKQAFH